MPDDLTRNEVVQSDSEEKTIYHVKDSTLGLNFISKIIYKNRDKVVVYPFSIREGSRHQKYRNIKEMVFEGLNGRFPTGTRPTFKTGYGFTTQPNRIIYFLGKHLPEIDKITISRNRKTKIWKKSFVMNFREFEVLRKKLSTEYGNLSEQRKCIINNYFVKLKPDKFSILKPAYKSGTFHNIIDNRLNTVKKLSSGDRESLYKLFKKLAFLKKEEINTEEIISTKKIVDRILIEEIISEFQKYLKSKRRNEEKWQDFFRRNTWIFSQIFSYPTVFFDDKAYVGGNRIDNKDSKIVDFLYQNKISKNLAIIEIKTHLSKLVKKNPYRGDDVYEIGKELNGAINQVLNQKYNLDKEYYSLRAKTDKEFYSFNPKCFVVIGKLSSLSKNQVKSFELFRNSCKDIEIITFDELYERIDTLLKIFDKEEQ